MDGPSDIETHSAARLPVPVQRSTPSAALRLAQMLFCALAGATIGALAGQLWGWGLFGFITGLMLGFAGRTAWVLAVVQDAQDEFSSGHARTEEEVRQALAEIRAQQK